MASKRGIFLVGMMAAGKTTIGRHLAELLRFDFVDSDSEVERRAGVDIAWIFDQEGEAGFRDREQRAIDDLTKRQRIVLATGGGAVLRAANRETLRCRGTVVYISATVDQIVDRVGCDRRRPLLRGGDERERVATLCRERESLYQAVAHMTFPTAGLPSRQVAENLAARLLD